MSCCCLKILNLCNVGVCGTLEIKQIVGSGASGLYTLLLDYLETSIVVYNEQTAGENLQFDVSGLNENYQYTGQIFDADGNQVPIIVGEDNYDCIKFRTIMTTRAQSSDVIPPVLNIPNTVVIEDFIGEDPVITGTTDEVIGLEDGSNTIVCDAFIGVRVTVIRGNIPIPGIPPPDGSNYFTKLLANNFITLSSPLYDGEPIRIQTIPE